MHINNIWISIEHNLHPVDTIHIELVPKRFILSPHLLLIVPLSHRIFYDHAWNAFGMFVRLWRWWNKISTSPLQSFFFKLDKFAFAHANDVESKEQITMILFNTRGTHKPFVGYFWNRHSHFICYSNIKCDNIHRLERVYDVRSLLRRLGFYRKQIIICWCFY